MRDFDFNGLFVFDLANNHQGSLEQGLAIIEDLAEVVQKHDIRAALKFQFRNLATFIHPEYINKKDIPHIQRFMSTAIDRAGYEQFIVAARKSGLLTMCTPFDEESVDLIMDMNIDIIKVASCSAKDWPLLKKIADTNQPIVASTGGLSMNEIDRLVSFFEYRRVYFSLMHCIPIYPTPNVKLNLNQITLLTNRFPKVTVGFSTHEAPDNYNAIRVAYAKGARIFERHVGLERGPHKLNKYSSSPEKIDKWLTAWNETVEACGGTERTPASFDEIESLRSLMRGVYAKRPIAKGQNIDRDSVFFAMPLQPNQLASGEWEQSFTADKDYATNAPLSAILTTLEVPAEEQIYRIMLQIKGMLNQARLFIGKDSRVEISHHYGLDRFREFGAVIIDCINRSYCKKLIAMLPRQKHPYHYHAKKEETFQLLNGDINVIIDGQRHRLQPGDTLVVSPRQWHKFYTLDGAIVEEISTTHYNDDSFYEDERITRLSRVARKTDISNWEAMTEDAKYC
ncbi:Sialic acid synthase [Desulfovibrionales bacterium]